MTREEVRGEQTRTFCICDDEEEEEKRFVRGRRGLGKARKGREKARWYFCQISLGTN